ncbi:iron complex outermembrane recepter protein [Parapedobacter composti]|uniref:Iron complex outermembrane recepter protein n=1 Tax=Parapedobacter composti TaxID=623281 RepID=A0A1I1E2L4_9SPHI|nr:TonB-dependent receptor [Parapedobacter composti]SFB81307.1 iron complex outermembrane recepter protein [Parapedobacter composti]
MKQYTTHLYVFTCICLTFVNLISAYPLAAQEVSAVLHGSVTSGGETVPAATVSIANTNLATKSDQSGNFKLNIPSGRITVHVYALGYAPYSQIVNVSANESIRLSVILEQTVVSLDEVVLDRQTGLTKRTPYAISGVEMQSLSKSGNPGGIAGALREIPGVSGAGMGPGIVKPFIRGLGFSRVVTIYQGNKLENHQWGQDHGLGLNNLGVSNVDVIKGPASILYGSGALGGVLLVKDDERYLNAETVTGSLGTAFNSNSNGIRTFGSLGNRFQSGVFINVDAAYENHADYKAGEGLLIGNSRFNNHTVRVHTGLDRERFKNKLSLTYHNQDLGIISDDELEDGHSLVTTRNDRSIQLPYQQIRDYVVSYNQETTHDKFETYLHVSHHYNDRNEVEESFDEIDLGLKQHNTFYSGRITLHPNQDFSHTFGLQGGFIATANKPVAEEILIPDARTTDFGIYYLSSLDWKGFYFQGGARFDYRKVNADASAPHLVDYGFTLPGDPQSRRLNVDFSGFSGSLGASYTLASQHQFKVNISTGFRAPDLAELFSNGPHPGTNRFETGNVDFKREQSVQADLSYSFGTPVFNIGASVYHNTVSNYIYFVATGTVRPEDGLEIWAFRQDNAVLYGTEWEASYRPLRDKQLELTAKGALVRGKLTSTAEDLTFIPADNYTLQLAHEPRYMPGGRAFVSLQHTAAQERIGFNELRTPGYTLLNAGVQQEFPLTRGTLTTSVHINNALDVRYVDHLSILRAFSIPNPGRNFNLAVGYRF